MSRDPLIIDALFWAMVSAGVAGFMFVMWNNHKETKQQRGR